MPIEWPEVFVNDDSFMWSGMSYEARIENIAWFVWLNLNLLNQG